jgi:hypothetical protein
MYIDEKLSSTEIAEKIGGVAPISIRRILHQNNIILRDAFESKKLSGNKDSTQDKLSLAARGRKLSESAKDKLRKLSGSKNVNWTGGLTLSVQGYICFTRSKGNGENAGKALHVVLAQWLYKRKLKQGEHVHHIDGNQLNNSPENLTILSAHDHAKIHQLGEKKYG